MLTKGTGPIKKKAMAIHVFPIMDTTVGYLILSQICKIQTCFGYGKKVQKQFEENQNSIMDHNQNVFWIKNPFWIKICYGPKWILDPNPFWI